MSNSLVQEKLAYFHRRSQYVVFDNEGYVKDSCQTLFELPAQVSIYEQITFMEAMQDFFVQLPVGEDVNFLCIDTTLMGREGYYNFYIKRQSADVLKWFIYDLTEFYSYLQPWQQEKNDQAIAGEHLRLQQRAARLEKKLLQYQNEELQRIEQMKTAFFSQVSHEMRTPLNSIVGLAHLLANQADPTDDSVQALKATAQHLTTIINDVLDWAKLENNTIEIHSAPFKSHPLIQNVGAAFRYRCEEKGVELKIQVSETVPECLIGDATRLAQILYNIVGNAVKFTDQGEIKLSADATLSSSQSVAHLRLSVADTGIGMTKEEQKRIANPYIQANDQIHQHYGGSGLGLSIVHKLVERLGGTWTINSQPQQGTTVTIKLAMPVGEMPEEEIPDRSPTFQHLSAVLVAEDDTINQKVLSQLLIQWGLKPTVVENGRQALEQLRTNQYDLLILDYQMPEVDGAEVLRVLHQEQHIVPTIVLSGDAHRIVLPSFMSGSTPVLTKPISPRVLLDKILVLDHQRSSPTIDLHYLRQITHNQPELMVDLMDTFIQEAPTAIEKIDQAWKMNDPILLNRAVHKAKPSFQYIGAAEAEPLLNRLEDDTERSERIEDGELLIQQLRELTQIAIRQLAQERNRVLSSGANKVDLE